MTRVPTDEEWLMRGIRLHDSELDLLRRYDLYYEGEQPLSYMHPELIQQLEGQVQQLVINWAQLVVDAIDERLTATGFRRPDSVDTDDEIWAIWQENDLDGGSGRAHVESLALGRSYLTVGAGDSTDDAPVITDESALDVIAITDPRTREVAAAVRRWSSDGIENPQSQADMATLYLPNKTSVYAKQANGTWQLEGTPDEHNLGICPVVPMVNRARRRKPLGVSEMKIVLPLVDAACKSATDMMVGGNFHALPRYFATGVTESDFTDEQGNPISVWKAVTGRIFATENEQAKIGAIAASDLSNFHNTLNALAQLVASLAGLPPHYMGFHTDNPASAEAIKSSEARLVRRCERKQTVFGEAWEQAMRIARRIQTGSWDRELERLEMIWRDASTPTIAQVADAATKKHQGGITPLRQTREDIGYSPVQIARMEQEDEKAAAADPLGAFVRQQAGGNGPAGLPPEPTPQPTA